jgi:hypothetical protein
MGIEELLGDGRRLAVRASDEAAFAAACFRAGIFGIDPPGRMVRMLAALERYGLLSATVTKRASSRGPGRGP